MSQGPIDYVQLTREGLRTVIMRAMSHIAEHGLHGEQHVYLSFLTQHPGVVMPDWLREEYPHDITIVLQHEFYNLAVASDRLSVELSFRERPATLVIPSEAVKSFSDPIANFSIDIPVEENGQMARVEAVDPGTTPGAEPEKDDKDGTATVVSLDAFRKK